MNEPWHRVLNQMVASVQRIGWELCDQRLIQHVHRYNFGRHQTLGLTSRQSTPWVWKERDANDAARGRLLAEPWPKAGPRPDVRPNSSSSENRVPGT